MSWEKTVLLPEEIDKLRLEGFAWNNIPGKSMLEPQAKQSYEVGYEEGLGDGISRERIEHEKLNILRGLTA